MALTLYELCGADDRRFSPYCWRTRLALAQKGLNPTVEPVGFTEKDKISFSGQDKVPIIRDGDTVVSDSWTIACYLEDTYADAAPLFGSDIGRHEARFINFWADTVLGGAIGGLIIFDVLNSVRPEDREYFQTTREKRFGRPLAEIQTGRDDRVAGFRQALLPLRSTLAVQPFLCGETPAYADFIVMGSFLWARGTSDYQLLETDDPVYAWRARMADLFDGLSRSTTGYDF